MFVNGKTSSSVSFIYSVFPLKSGKFQIPALDVPVDNQNFKTEPIAIEVVDQGSNTTAGQDPQLNTANLSDKIFLQLQPSKTDVYLNEKLPIKILLFITGVNAADPQYPQFDAPGFSFSKYDRAQQFQQIINGIRYNIVEFDATLYPTRTGELKLGPAKMELNLIVRNTDQGRTGSLFDDDFFNTIFDRQEKHPITVTSKDVTINVKDLPETEKPADFSGGVGQFDFDVTASPTDVKVGDPITLKMSLKGEGNLAAINFPSIKDQSNFKVYDPSIKEENGVKKFEQVVIPRNKDVKEIPAFNFSYFNTALQKYVSVTKGPFAINVTEAEGGKAAPAIVGLQPQPTAEQSLVKDTLGQDIVFIKETPGAVYSRGEYFYQQWPFYVVLILLGLGYVVFLIYYQMTHRLNNDQDYARRYHAPKYARSGLELARKYLAEKRPREFYDAVYKTLQTYLSHKFSISLGDVNYERIKTLIGIQSHETLLAHLKFIFDECDRVRYSAVSPQESDMSVILKKLEQTIDEIERLKT